MTLKITQSNASGFGTVAGDELNYLIDGETGIVPTTYIQTVYEAIPFSVDIKFEGKYLDTTDPLADPAVYVYADAVNNSSTFDWASLGLTYTKVNGSTCRISGSHQNPFPDQFYRFVLPDLSLVVLPGNTTTEFYSLEKYQMPSPVSIMKSFGITVTIPKSNGIAGGFNVGPYFDVHGNIIAANTETELVTMDQWVHWSYPSAVAAIAAARARGLK
jgi:hypothetical protein